MNTQNRNAEKRKILRKNLDRINRRKTNVTGLLHATLSLGCLEKLLKQAESVACKSPVVNH